MRILLVGAASSVHLMRWANAFAQRGHEVHVATQHAAVEGFDPEVRVHRFPHRMGMGYIMNRPRLRRLIRTLAPDVVNAHYASGYGTLMVRAGAPLVLNVWGSDVYEFPDAGPIQRWLLRRNLLRADRVVSTSEVMAKRTLQVCPAVGSITVVPFGVDVQRFVPGTDARSGITIGTVKSLAPKYGIDTLLSAFAAVAGDDADLRLRIVGGGPQQEALRTMAERLGISERVDFVGAVPHEQVPDELRKLDVYVALSRTHSESFGVAVIEASACGLPVVVSRVGGLPEVVEEGVTGLIVPHDDAEAAADALRKLLASEALRRSMGEAGRRRVERMYAWPHCVDRLLDVLAHPVNHAPHAN